MGYHFLPDRGHHHQFSWENWLPASLRVGAVLRRHHHRESEVADYGKGGATGAVVLCVWQYRHILADLLYLR